MADPSLRLGAALAPQLPHLLSRRPLTTDLPPTGPEAACVPGGARAAISAKADMRNTAPAKWWRWTPQTYEVFGDGELLTCENQAECCDAQRLTSCSEVQAGWGYS